MSFKEHPKAIKQVWKMMMWQVISIILPLEDLLKQSEANSWFFLKKNMHKSIFKSWGNSCSMLWSPLKHLFYVEQYYYIPLWASNHPWNFISEITLVITQWAKTDTLTICVSTSLFSSKSLFRLKVCWISFSSFPLLTIETIFLGLDLVFGTAYLSDFLAYKCHWLMLVSLKKRKPFFLFHEGTIVWAHSAIHLCPPKFLVTKELVCSTLKGFHTFT